MGPLRGSRDTSAAVSSNDKRSLALKVVEVAVNAQLGRLALLREPFNRRGVLAPVKDRTPGRVARYKLGAEAKDEGESHEKSRN